jgi:Sec-independent protein translocase protein TatA
VNLALLNIGPMELLIMAAAAVMLFGGDLPATARKAAQAVGRLRSLAADLGREFSIDEHAARPARMDQKHLMNPDNDSVALRPQLPGRREDEPLEKEPVENKDQASSSEVFDPLAPADDSAEQQSKREP